MSPCYRLLVVLAQHCVIEESKSAKYPRTWTKNVQLNNSAAIFGINKYGFAIYVYKLYHQCFSVEYGFFYIYRGFIAQYNGHADLEMRRLTALE